MRALIVLLLLLSPVAARAQSWAAMAKFGVGEQFFDQGEYENAIECFTEAYKALPLPVILYDLALVHYRLDNIYLAREYLRMFARRIKRSDPFYARVDRLGNTLAAAVDEDYDAMGLTFACDPVKHRCGIARWSK